MPNQDAVYELIYSVIEEEEEDGLAKEPEAEVFGALDSMGLINFITAVESAIEEKMGVTLSLMEDDSALDQGSTPFKTVASMAEHVSALIDAKAGQ